MKLKEKQIKEVAEAIANSEEKRGMVQVELDGGTYLDIDFEKGAGYYVEPETGFCNVFGAWCNIFSINIVDEDNDVRPVVCDFEKLENMVAEYMNN